MGMSQMVRNWLKGWREIWRTYRPLIVGLGLGAVVFFTIWFAREKHPVRHLRAIEKAHSVHKSAHTEDYVAVWLPRAALLNGGVCVLLILTCPWLLRQSGKALASTQPASSPSGRRWLWAATGGAILVSGTLNYPRLSQSLWGDEETTMRRCVVGEYLPDGHDGLTWNPVDWKEAFFFYRDPNNHPMFSVLAKLSHDAFPPNDDPAGFYFNETAIRLPAWLFGLVGLAALAWLADILGWQRGGMLAVIWLALHPWHVRYGVDARGYALLFALIPTALTFLILAARTGLLRWWVSFGLSQFLVLWAYPGALYLVFCMNLAGLGMVFCTGGAWAWRWAQFRRFALAGVLGGMLTLQLLAPCISPMRLYLQRERMLGKLEAHWFHDTFSQLFTGVYWHPWDVHKFVVCWQQKLDSQPLVVWTLFGLLAVVVGAGVVRIFRAGGVYRWLLVAMLLPGPVMIGATVAAGNILYPWYLMLVLPGLALMVGVGLESAMSWARRLWLGWVIAPIVLGFFGWAVHRQNSLLRSQSVEPNRESVCAMRTERNPRNGHLGDVRTLAFVMHTRGYDPAAHFVHDLAELQAELARVDAAPKPCFVHFADRPLAWKTYPEIMRFIEGSGLFEPLPPFLGLYEPSTRLVYRYKGEKPAPAANVPP